MKIDEAINLICSKLVEYSWEGVLDERWKPTFIENKRTKENEEKFKEWLNNELKNNKKFFKSVCSIPYNNKESRIKFIDSFILYFWPKVKDE